MSLIIKNIDTANVDIGDLGITLTPGQEYDLTQDRPMDVASSTDLSSAITAGTIAVLDPLDDVTQLSLSNAQAAVAAMNDSHFRIRGGELNQIDDVSLSSTQSGDILEFNGTSWVNVQPTSSSDELVKVSANDTTAGYLNGKLITGTGIAFTENNDGGNETLTISTNLNVFETISTDSGSVVADVHNDTLTLSGGTGISTTGTPGTDTITVNLNATLDQINDVTYQGSPAPQDGQILVYNASGPYWENQDLNTIPASSDSYFSNTTVTADYTGTTNVVVLVDTTANNVTVTLPSASSFTNKFFHIKWIAGPSNRKPVLAAQTGETIDGQNSWTLGQVYDNFNVFSNGSAWWIL